ncbi:MAG: hypothetical protein N3A38_17080, partial [Planctomycetota bacterium]|nr:hypothetical protein [Planctomycetota bacterium]
MPVAALTVVASRSGHRLLCGAAVAAASIFFLACCAAWRCASGRPGADAPVPAPFFATTLAGGSTSSGPSGEADGLEIAPKADAQPVSARPFAYPRPQPPKAAQSPADRIREYLKERPAAWATALRMANTALRERAGKEEGAELHRLRSELEARCMEAAERDLKARVAIAEALCRDGFLRAAEAEIWEIREDYPDHPAADAVREKAAAVRALAERYRSGYAMKAAAHLRAGQLGHAAAFTEWLAARAESDGAETGGEFERTIAELASGIRSARLS